MSSSPVCVDASLVARLLVGPDAAQVWDLFDTWTAGEVVTYAPTLLIYELTNVFHTYQQRGFLSTPTAQLIHEAAMGLPILLEPHATLAAAALRISSTLRLPAAYDAYYLRWLNGWASISGRPMCVSSGGRVTGRGASRR